MSTSVLILAQGGSIPVLPIAEETTAANGSPAL